VPQDYTQAAAWYLKAAVKGEREAQRLLGGLYYFGHGVPPNYAQAAAWYCHAAVQDDHSAQRLLGDLYYFGRGVPQEYTHAAVWYRKAAEQGNLAALLSLGYLYSTGRGVPQDYAEAYFWFEIAHVTSKRAEFDLVGLVLFGRRVDVPIAGKGETVDLASTEDRDEAASHLTPADLSRVQERARKWSEDHPAKPQ